jgi:flagellar protein FlaG
MDMTISNIKGTSTRVHDVPLSGSISGPQPQKESSDKAPEEPITLSSEAVEKLLQSIENHLQSMNISLSFSTYGKNNENIAVVVRERETGKVIREIPPKELQNLYTKLGELVGMIFNHSV